MTSYRLVNSDEEKYFYDLTLYAFNRLNTPERQRFFHQLFSNSQAYGAFEDDELESGFLSIPFISQIGADRFKTQGISYVSSYPENSGKGHITNLMTKFFEDAQKNNVLVSYLAPFSFPFYRRFGYEEVFDRSSYHLQNIDIPKLKMPAFAKNHKYSIKRMGLKDALSIINQLHNNSYYNRNGGIVRSEWWNKYLTYKHPWEVAICKVDGKLSGYLIFSRKGNISFQIEELFYESKIALWDLLMFVSQHKTAYKYFDYVSGNPQSRVDIFPDPHEKKTLEVSTKPYMMARIINLSQFLSNYHLEESVNDQFILNVEDEFLPSNCGFWQINIEKGNIILNKISKSGHAIDITIQRLTQILYGYRKAEDLLDIDLSEESIDHLNNLQKKFLKPMLWDYF